MVTAYHNGIDFFTSDPNEPPNETLRCKACGSKLLSEKTTEATSTVEAMAGHKHEAWTYRCPHSAQELHKNLVALVKERDGLVSQRLRGLVNTEIGQKRKRLWAQVGGEPPSEKPKEDRPELV